MTDGPRLDRTAAARAAVGLFAGFALLACVGAVAIEVLIPVPAAGVWLRVQHHFFDAAETLGVGAVAACIAGAAALVQRPRWVAPVALAVPSGLVLYLAIGDVLRRVAGYVAIPWLGALQLAVSLAALVTIVPLTQSLGAACSTERRLRAAAIVLATGGMIADHLALRDDYDAIHGGVALVCATFAGAAMAPVAERAVRRMARRRAGRAGLAALAVLAVLGLAWPPSNEVRCELFRRSSALASWALATTVWQPPGLHAATSVRPSPWLHDRSAYPPIPPTEPPLLGNDGVVVLITIDAVRGDVVDDPTDETALRTLSQLRRTGVHFRHASAAGTQTVLSLSALFSGRPFSELFWTWHSQGETRFIYPADDPSPRFPALLSEHGVDTASYDSLTFLAGEYGVARGFREDDVVVTGRVHADARDVIAPLVERIEHAGPGPLFLYTHLMEPHEPYDRGPLKKGAARDRWLSEVMVADAQVGHVLHALRRSLGDRWVLVVTSDHGEAFGDHETNEHGKTLYEELLHVPLLVAGPRVVHREVDERVSLLDLGPTILDLFGVPTPPTFEGQSLAPLLAGREVALTRPLVAEGRLRRSLTQPDGLKVIEDPRRKLVEVYDLSTDPRETRNLFDAEPARSDAALAELRAFFEAHTLKKDGYSPPYKE